jgi:uncharacterized protein
MPWIILGALAIGLSLGMLGSGGSILTVPVLTYLVGQPEKLAIASSLAIVGGISAIAVIPYAWKREIDWRSVIWFGLPGMLSTWLGAMVAQSLPGFVQLLIFSVIMFMASWRMIKSKNNVAYSADAKPHVVSKQKMARTGLMVGLVTGIVGVGGGFLIVPALILLVGLNMRRAVGTSLVVISSNAFSGFIKYAAGLKALHLVLNWQVIGMFILIGGTGTIAGNMLGTRVPQQRLKQIFGVLLVGMAAYIIIRELPKLFHS